MENGRPVTHTSGEALPAGTILLGRYRIDRLLGQGGFGITYAASDLRTQSPVAVKELFPSGYVSRDPNRRTIPEKRKAPHICVCALNRRHRR